MCAPRNCQARCSRIAGAPLALLAAVGIVQSARPEAEGRDRPVRPAMMPSDMAMLQVQQLLKQAQAEAEDVIQRDAVRDIAGSRRERGKPWLTKRSSENASILANEHFPGLDKALETLDHAYEGHANDCWYKAHGRSERTHSHEPGNDSAASDSVATTYGELLPTSVAAMLAHAGARPGQRYFDLGSGTGKTVLLAWLLGLNATGVELVDQRYSTACEALHRIPKDMSVRNAGINFVRGSFLEVDFSDADIIFTDSVMFSNEVKEGLAKAARRMKPGAKVISFQGLPGSWLHDALRFEGPTSWATHTEWMIQEVAPGAEEAIAASTAKSPAPAHETCGI